MPYALLQPLAEHLGGAAWVGLSDEDQRLHAEEERLRATLLQLREDDFLQRLDAVRTHACLYAHDAYADACTHAR